MAEPPNWLNLDHVWLPYTQMAGAPLPLPVVGADGVRLRLADGRELIDGISSWWTACHGYNHPHIVETIRQQVGKIAHVMFAGLAHEPAYTLAKRLAALLPGDLNHVFFSESGSVSVEIALKMALQYWRNVGESPRRGVLAFRDGYHGDTFMAMAVSDPAVGMHDMFSGIVPPALFADLPRDEATTAALDVLLEREAGTLAAVIVEPLVQGAGGFQMHDAATLARIRAACDRHGILLIADEIMTGFGRTGSMFAIEQANAVPDIVCLSKALTGGTLPLAATVASRAVFESFGGSALMHGPTYMANPLACAAANASLDLFETDMDGPRLAQVAAIEAQLARELEPCRTLPGVVDVRVRGAIGVVELATDDASRLRPRFVEKGVWLRPFGSFVYVMPPFVIAPGDLSILTSSLCEVIENAGMV